MTVLGEFKSYNSVLAISNHTVDIVDPAANNKLISGGVPNTVPDQIMIHGTVAPSNAIVTFQWRAAKPLPGAPSTEWRVLGDKGELRLTSSSWSLNVGDPTVKLELSDTSLEFWSLLIPTKINGTLCQSPHVM